MASPARTRRLAGVSGADGRSGADEGQDATRRTEILQTANSVIAASGLRTSLQQIADAAGILAGSLYHPFESQEAILVELTRSCGAALDRVGESAVTRLDEPDSRPISEQIVDVGCAIAR